jgi:2-polyprenyl-6-methoxyphenol hydroxylase-like FAD-dependent oxidoreductase
MPLRSAAALKDTSIAIAGAGPVGLTAAMVLGDAGFRVFVLEAASGLQTDPRASTFHPPTLEMFERSGITAELLQAGLVCPHWQIRWHPSGERALFDLSVLADDTRYPFRLQCEQWKLVRALYRRLQLIPSVDVRFGATVTGVTQDDHGVQIRYACDGRIEALKAGILIGADGAHSAVRKEIGQALLGDTYPETVMIVETQFPFEAHLEGLSFTNYCWRDDGNFSMLKVPDRWRVGIYPLAGMSVEEQLADHNVERMLQAICAQGEAYTVLAKRPYRTHNRIVDRYRVGRVFLAGDAAHLNSPTGGMGMNGGLHDAFNLTEKLIAVLNGVADDAFLDRYERQRRPVALAEILQQADRNRARMREPDAGKRRAMMHDLQEIAADRSRLKAYMLKTSMIEGLRRAALIP